MDEHEADQLWRELADTDRAAKRGFGVGFGNASTGADPLERSSAPAGLASTFRKATDIDSKEMAQEQISVRDRIRARVKEAMENKQASQRREDSQWENFVTQKKRERVGLDSIVDEHGRMLGCTYNYSDTDNADLDNAIAKATAARAAGKSAAEEDHAAAIFGGGDRAGRRNAGPEANRRRGSPDRGSGRDARDRDRSRRPDMHREEGRPARHHDREQSSRRHDRYHRDQEHSHRAASDRDGRRRTHREHDEREDARHRHSGASGGHGRPRDGEDRARREGGRSRPTGEVGAHRDGEKARERRHLDDDRGERRSRDGSRGVRQHARSDERRREDGRRCHRDKGDAAPVACESGQQGAHTAGGAVPQRTGVLEAAGVRREGGSLAAGNAAEGGLRGSAGARTGAVHGVDDGPWPAGVAGGGVALGAGSAALQGLVPDGAVVVQESEITRGPPEVEAHDALDASVVLKARGSWREQLKRRMEGAL